SLCIYMEKKAWSSRRGPNNAHYATGCLHPLQSCDVRNLPVPVFRYYLRSSTLERQHWLQVCRPRRETVETLLWTLVLALPLLILFAPVLHGYVLDGMIDRKEITNPFHYLNVRAFRHGQFPQWDPYHF